MQTPRILKTSGTVFPFLAGLGLATTPLASAHHSAAAFDRQTVRVLTGVVERVYPGASHQEIFFRLLNEARDGYVRDAEGKPQVWSVEMASASASANEGISANTFPPNTVFSIALHPARNGKQAGLRVNGGAVVRCPERSLPAPGMHCDTVEGSTSIGFGKLVEVSPSR